MDRFLFYFSLSLSRQWDALAERSTLRSFVRKLNLWLIKQRLSIRRVKRKSRKTHFKNSYWLINVLVCVCLVRVASLFVCQSSSMLHTVIALVLFRLWKRRSRQPNSLYIYFECNYDCYLYLLRSVRHALAIRYDDNETTTIIYSKYWMDKWLNSATTRHWKCRAQDAFERRNVVFCSPLLRTNKYLLVPVSPAKGSTKQKRKKKTIFMNEWEPKMFRHFFFASLCLGLEVCYTFAFDVWEENLLPANPCVCREIESDLGTGTGTHKCVVYLCDGRKAAEPENSSRKTETKNKFKS